MEASPTGGATRGVALRGGVCTWGWSFRWLGPVLGAGLTVCSALLDFPGPNLTLSEPEVSEGNLVTVSCEAHAGAVVTLSDAQPGPPSSQVKFLINASAEDDGRLFSCSAALEVARKVLYKNRTLELRVLCEWDCWTMPSKPRPFSGPAPMKAQPCPFLLQIATVLCVLQNWFASRLGMLSSAVLDGEGCPCP
jgi:hypothetical protein